MIEKTFILKNNKNIIQEVTDFIFENRGFSLPNFFTKKRMFLNFKETNEAERFVGITFGYPIFNPLLAQEKNMIRNLAIEIIASAIHKMKPTDTKFLEKELGYFQNTKSKKSNCISTNQTLYDIERIENFI
jgi:hypothetical protein